jgi:hypothetical protein
MKTAKFNGNNVAKLEFDYFIRYRPRHNVYILGMEKQVKKLFEDIRIYATHGKMIYQINSNTPIV